MNMKEKKILREYAVSLRLDVDVICEERKKAQAHLDQINTMAQNIRIRLSAMELDMEDADE